MHPRLARALENAPGQLPGCGGNGDHHLRDAVLLGDLGDGFDLAEHRAAGHPQAAFQGVVIDEARDQGMALVVVFDLVAQANARGTGAHDECCVHHVAVEGALAPLAQDAQREPRRRHASGAEHEIDQKDAARKALQTQEEHHRAQKEHRAQGVAAQDVAGIGHAEVPPPP